MRDIYKVVDYKVFSHTDRAMIEASVTPNVIVAVATSGLLMEVDEELVAQLKPSHVAVPCSLLHYGKGERNLLDEVMFYSKRNPKVCRVWAVILFWFNCVNVVVGSVLQGGLQRNFAADAILICRGLVVNLYQGWDVPWAHPSGLSPHLEAARLVGASQRACADGGGAGRGV